MSVEQLEQSALQLSRDEKRRFANWFYEHESDFVGEELTESTQKEILRRAQELRANPGLAQPVDDEYFARMKRKVADALAAKASAR